MHWVDCRDGDPGNREWKIFALPTSSCDFKAQSEPVGARCLAFRTFTWRVPSWQWCAGTHDPALIRPMTPQDLERLVAACSRLPSLLLTVAAETVGPDQIRQLVDAGIVVSIGHSDADFVTAEAAFGAGASQATHLFNAMSQLLNREPGLVGAILGSPAVHAGLIADGIHVRPAAIRIALTAKRPPTHLPRHRRNVPDWVGSDELYAERSASLPSRWGPSPCGRNACRGGSGYDRRGPFRSSDRRCDFGGSASHGLTLPRSSGGAGNGPRSAKKGG